MSRLACLHSEMKHYTVSLALDPEVIRRHKVAVTVLLEALQLGILKSV